MSQRIVLSEEQRFSLALLLELEEDFPGCLDELAALPAGSKLGEFVRLSLPAALEPTRKRA